MATISIKRKAYQAYGFLGFTVSVCRQWRGNTNGYESYRHYMAQIGSPFLYAPSLKRWFFNPIRIGTYVDGAGRWYVYLGPLTLFADTKQRRPHDRRINGQRVGPFELVWQT